MTINWQRAVPRHGAVATANPLGAAVGAEVLEAGGNAVDAAVAAAFAMGVVEPLDCGLGAGGFAVVHDAVAGRTLAIDFMGAAPAAAGYDLVPEFLTYTSGYRIRVRGEANEVGARSVAVPGAVRGLALLAARFGTMPLADLVAPAARLAEAGFAIDAYLARRIADTAGYLRRYPASAALFLHPDGSPRAAGEILVQPDLARSLRRLAEAGPDDFYAGDLARSILSAVAADGGFMTAADLSGYRPIVRAPLEGRFVGLDVATMPPPSTGAYVFAGLDALARQPAADRHLALARAMQQMFDLRAATLGDPEHVDVDLSPLGAIDDGWRTPETRETTSLATIDRSGSAVCLTYSNMNHSGIVVPGTGIVLNNQMLLFNPWPGSPNSVAPGKRPVSSMMPTLVFEAGEVRLAIGASGATRIPTAIMQTAYGCLVEGLPLETSVSEPRIHCEVDRITADAELGPTAERVARQLGCTVDLLPGRDSMLGVVQAVAREPDGAVVAVGDPRAGGRGRVV